MSLSLAAATGGYISGSWGPQWSATHGETRSSARYTFYIGLRRTRDGNYWTCILVTQQNGTESPVEGTEVNWGTTQPTLQNVLTYYRTNFGGVASSSGAQGSGGGSGSGGGAAGGGGGDSKNQNRSTIYNYGDGGDFKIEGDETIWCDQYDNPKTAAVGASGPPKDAVAVFKGDGNMMYYPGPGKKHTTVTVEYEDPTNKEHPFIKISGKKHPALLVDHTKAVRPAVSTEVPKTKTSDSPSSATATKRPPLGAVDQNTVTNRTQTGLTENKDNKTKATSNATTSNATTSNATTSNTAANPAQPTR